MDVKRTASTSGKPRPVLPPPPPPASSQTHTPNKSVDTNKLDIVDKCRTNKEGETANEPSDTRNVKEAVNSVDVKGQNESKTVCDSKPRHLSSSSTGSGGKSPRINFRKSRPAPPPPKPPPDKTITDSTTPTVPTNAAKNSNTASENSSRNLNGKSDCQTSMLSKDQSACNKQPVKPTATPPLPPSDDPKSPAPTTPQNVLKLPVINSSRAEDKSPVDKQLSGTSDKKLDSAPLTKPTILSPKPKMKPTAPPPAPPAPPAKAASVSTDVSGQSPSVRDDHVQVKDEVSDFSDIMRDVLGVIDNKASSQPDTTKASDPVITDSSEVSDICISSETGPTVTGVTSTQNDSTSFCQNDTEKEDQSSATSANVCCESKQTTVTCEDQIDVKTELQIDIPQCPQQPHGSSSPVHKPTVVHNRGSNSPKRAVRRRKTAIGLMLCCGLGKAFLRDKESPPIELPLRTEGTLPRGNHVVQSASLHSDLMQSSHSPKKLEQSDIVSNTCHVTSQNNSVIKNDMNGININDPNLVPNGHNENDAATGSNDVTCGKSTDIIDVLCESEKPISVNKLQGDNKDLVVASESTSSSQTNIDVTTRPVVHGVKLVKVEKSATFTSFTSKDIPARPSTPRMSKVGARIADKSDSVSHLPITPPDKPLNEDTSKCNATGVGDVRLRKDSKSHVDSRDAEKVRSQSMEDLSCIVVDLDLDLANHIKRSEGYRSSFIGEDVKSKPPLMRAPGEVQTLLKHSKQDEDKVYALPQPACYGDDTLRAVKLITDKYDTLERWKIRAVSFRGDGTVRKNSQNVQINLSPSRQISSESKNSDVIPEVTESDVTDSSVDVASEQTTKNTDTSYRDMLERSGVAVRTCELSPAEISRIRLFYCSRFTEVSVATSVVDLLLSSKEVQNACDVKEWKQTQTGVPVLVLNTGQGRRRRELTIVLADRDTSFPLWTDTINYLSQYEAASGTLHTMHLSSSLMKIAAFQFRSDALAEDFMKQFKEITQDPNDDLWKVSIDPKKHKKKKSTGKIPVKGDISQPIQFDHVTSVTAHDQNLAVTLSEFIPGKNITKDKADAETFRQRAYSG